MFLSEGVKELLVSMRLPPTNFSQGRIYSKVYKKWNIYIYKTFGSFVLWHTTFILKLAYTQIFTHSHV